MLKFSLFIILIILSSSDLILVNSCYFTVR